MTLPIYNSQPLLYHTARIVIVIVPSGVA